MSDAYWAMRAAVSRATQRDEVEEYLRDEWPGESAEWVLRGGGTVGRSTVRGSPGAFARWIRSFARGPDPRSGSPSES